MSKLARGEGGVIVEIPLALDGFALADCYSADYLADLAEVPDDAEIGWTWDGAAWGPPPVPTLTLAERQAAAIAAVDARKGAAIAAGAPAGGLHVAVDDGARADMGAMATTALAALSGAVTWPEAYALGWITTTNERIGLQTPADGLALAASVGAWYAALVQHARDLKDAVLAAVDEAALDAIDVDAGWPGGE